MIDVYNSRLAVQVNRRNSADTSHRGRYPHHVTICNTILFRIFRMDFYQCCLFKSCKPRYPVCSCMEKLWFSGTGIQNQWICFPVHAWHLTEISVFRKSGISVAVFVTFEYLWYKFHLTGWCMKAFFFISLKCRRNDHTSFYPFRMRPQFLQCDTGWLQNIFHIFLIAMFQCFIM